MRALYLNNLTSVMIILRGKEDCLRFLWDAEKGEMSQTTMSFEQMEKIATDEKYCPKGTYKEVYE